MLPEIWEPDLKVLFVGTAVDELSDTLGFYHLHPRDRFWELLAIGGITPERIITKAERKALAEGHARGNLSDPVRIMFAEKKISRLLRLGIGLAFLNGRVIAISDTDKAARPVEEDIELFTARVVSLQPAMIALVIKPDIAVELFRSRLPGVTETLGPQPFNIGKAEVWLLGSTSSSPRGEALTRQEDAFFSLGERMRELSRTS